MSGKRIALLTGATSGWTALGLSGARFRIVAVGRDSQRTEALATWVGRKHPGARIDTVLADLSRMTEVSRLAAAVRHRTDKLNLLVNNAGLMRANRVETSEGHEMDDRGEPSRAFHLTPEPLPILEAAPGARIVNVGSASSDGATIDPDDLEWKVRRWPTMRAYKLLRVPWTPR